MDIEKDLTELFQNYSVKPTAIMVNKDAVAAMAKRRPYGGNSRQRRNWKRMWTPRPAKLA